jgi:UDP-N-acetylglucosamine 3-dehydrogenase
MRKEKSIMRAVVIGVGSMGRNHARVYAELEEVQLVAVSDLDQSQAEKVASQFGVRAYANYVAMLESERPDLASVVVPTREHLNVARAAIERGIHVLVEKPIASTLAEGQEMIRLAEQYGVKLSVGHIERFNPAIIELKQRLECGELGRVFEIHARRLGPFPPRIRDVGVVVDLATHDLDIMRWLVGSPVQRIYAEMERRIHTEHEDLLLGLLKFADGTLGILDINWLTPTKIRELVVTGERGMFVANYLTQELCFYKNNQVESNWSTLGTFCGVSEGDMIRFRIDRREPLKEELRAFAMAVAQSQLPRVTGWDGLQALALAQKVLESSRIRQTIWLSQGGETYASMRRGIRQDRLAAGSSIRS